MGLRYVRTLLGMGGAYVEALLDMSAALGLPLPLHSCNGQAHHRWHGRKVKFFFNFFFVCFGLVCPNVLAVAFFCMAPFLHLPLVWNAPCCHCSSLYILCGLSRHVKCVHPRANLVSQVSQIALFLQVSYPLVSHPSFILLASWGWFRA